MVSTAFASPSRMASSGWWVPDRTGHGNTVGNSQLPPMLIWHRAGWSWVVRFGRHQSNRDPGSHVSATCSLLASGQRAWDNVHVSTISFRVRTQGLWRCSCFYVSILCQDPGAFDGAHVSTVVRYEFASGRRAFHPAPAIPRLCHAPSSLSLRFPVVARRSPAPIGALFFPFFCWYSGCLEPRPPPLWSGENV